MEQETKEADKLFAADILILPTSACLCDSFLTSACLMLVVSNKGGMDMQSFLI